MQRPYFTDLEKQSEGTLLPLDDFIARLAFNEQGLIPVITQDESSLQVLMLAWMTEESIRQTLATGNMTYWSRSRQSLWIKGETSGHFQRVRSMYFDCDGDAILCKVTQTGAACHTLRDHCFYFEVQPEQAAVVIRSSPD